ncbi:pentapeptide repeat-containing protein [Nonomuraea sp. NPDC052265]|uniref:pentapeptide repeat-containing protein n=1 Tax=Nonomuraea sp. NPDC052265 TaxID=3364374 RepID=UPI0037CA1F38
MGFLRRSPRQSARPPELRSPRSMWWWALPAALLVCAAVWGVSAWLLKDVGTPLSRAEQISARIEAVRTALAAGAGAGAAVTLLLAVRRQRHQELAAAHTTHDAVERRTTELYTKAAELLGSDQAPVRLAGLHALERLAQDTPALRQTIMDVICSYLRMPWTPPAEQDRHEKIRTAQRAARVGTARQNAGRARDPHEERQVRLTAQRILATHLRYQKPPARRWWQHRSTDPNAGHWHDIRLDLTGAALTDLNLRDCRVGTALFSGATFTGDALFSGATFTGDADFEDATFTDAAIFMGTTFTGNAEFDGATFTSDAMFMEATFTGDAAFAETTFTGAARFARAAFTGDAWFGGTTFADEARFARAAFTGTAWFSGAAFAGDAVFEEATFTRSANLDGVSGLERAVLNGVRVARTERVTRRWPPCWRAEEAADGWQTLRLTANAEGADATEGEPGTEPLE